MTRRKTKLVFYLGGPEAERGNNWWYVKGGVLCGCALALSVGVKIPLSTYSDANPDVSAEVARYPRHGWNYTAILPLEVDA